MCIRTLHLLNKLIKEAAQKSELCLSRAATELQPELDVAAAARAGCGCCSQEHTARWSQGCHPTTTFKNQTQFSNCHQQSCPSCWKDELISWLSASGWVPWGAKPLRVCVSSWASALQCPRGEGSDAEITEHLWSSAPPAHFWKKADIFPKNKKSKIMVQCQV